MGIVINFGEAKTKSDLEKKIMKICALMITYHREDRVDTFEYDLLLSKLFALGLSNDDIFELMIFSELNK